MRTVHTLLIDDDPILNLLMKRMMERVQFYPEPKEFSDAVKALQYLRDNYNLTEFFVIFLDLYMPEVDGIEFLNDLGQFARSKNVFVYVVSSTTDTEEIEKVVKNPLVREFLPKPIFSETLAVIKDIIEGDIKGILKE